MSIRRTWCITHNDDMTAFTTWDGAMAMSTPYRSPIWRIRFSMHAARDELASSLRDLLEELPSLKRRFKAAGCVVSGHDPDFQLSRQLDFNRFQGRPLLAITAYGAVNLVAAPL